MATLSIQPDSFHGEWNYTILPRHASVDNIIPSRLLIVFSLHRTRYENPNEGVIQGVVATLPNVHIVCTQLSAKCSPLLPASDFSHLTNFPAKGNVHDSCCGGTIYIKIDGNQTTYGPSRMLHRQFVRGLPHPLCLRYLTKT